MTVPASRAPARAPQPTPVARTSEGDDARLRAAQELTGLAWWRLDLRTGKHEWSEAMFHLVGLPPSAAAPNQEEFLALLHPEDRAAAENLAEHGFVGNNRGVFRVVHPDGSVRHLQSWHDVITDGDGAVVAVTGATMDVTARETALRELAESRSKLVAALELTRTGTWEWDLHTGEFHCTPRMRELLGVRAGTQLPAEAVLGIIHPDDHDRVRQDALEVLATGQSRETECRVLLPGRGIRHIRALAAVRTTASGEPAALWGTAVDVTAQVEAAARLSASEQHFRLAFDNAPIGMSLISLAPESRGRYLEANDAFLEMVGYTAEELRGQHFTALTEPADRAADTERFESVANEATPQITFEKHYLRRDGSTVTAWLTSAVARDANDAPLYLITHAVDLSERLREQEALERLALTDTLTGLANRTLLTDRVTQALARLHRSGGACAMLLLDIDRFKLVNDSMGHLVGDALLVEVAGRLADLNRADATVARLGGDEFVVLVEGLADPAQVQVIADRLLDAVRRPYDLSPHVDSLVVTVSMGISVATRADRTHVDLYREADLALYRAKDAGRDQWALFDDALRARAEARLGAEQLLRRALEEDRLVPVFQPVIDLEQGMITSAEALVRIRDGERLVLPAEFIEVAEETGLIGEVDARVFELVIQQFARIAHDPDTRLQQLSTNVSARSLEDPGFVGRLKGALAWYGVPGDIVRVELTERSLLEPSPVVRESLRQLAELGVHIGLDDFGTGYSALAYLQTFALQFLKIDRSFVSRLGRSTRDDAVVSAVIDLAHAHDLVVTAEGVETAKQLRALRAMGCDRAQGYLLGKPMPAEDLVALIRSRPRW